ncbi:hypothetical protein VTN00DRAFT_5985 [Thermoascus crustaceus]|uniref:uncharacterized protein n=1 Tax=Thermoascus crustaceus TaxID=5088 RepID=UPI003742747C
MCIKKELTYKKLPIEGINERSNMAIRSNPDNVYVRPRLKIGIWTQYPLSNPVVLGKSWTRRQVITWSQDTQSIIRQKW